MKLGILVNTDRHVKDLVGLAKAALSKGHEVIVFFMDSGVKLLSSQNVKDLCNNPGISMSFCDYTTEKNGVSKEEFCDKMICGSQYNNATMNSEADRVILL
ncbi:MAG: DsrE family protein [Nitrospira sp.]|nr:DsrE family protein [Nitrospira sp.]